MKNIIILPYFAYEEAERYVRILDFYKENHQPLENCEFLCANRSFIEPHKELIAKAEELAPVKVFTSASTVSAYPDGPTIFFWEIMDYIQENYEHDGGFVLWHESDMIAVRSDWVERLEKEWKTKKQVQVMGLYDPGYYMWKSNSFRPPHFNGGVCYSKDLSGDVGQQYRIGFFDLEMLPGLDKKKLIKSKHFVFSNLGLIAKHIRNKDITFLHGIAQSKDLFIDTVIKVLKETEESKRNAYCNEVKEEPCCQFFYKKWFIRICTVHIASSFDRVRVRFWSYVIYFWVKLKELFTKG